MPAQPKLTAASKATRNQILDAAERLLAMEGLEAVSLRQIGIAAGSSNHFAVQYHFGDKPRLVRAIFERRLPSLEVARAGLLAEVKRDGRLSDPHALLNVMLRPLSEELDSNGRCSYAALLLGLHQPGAAGLRLDAGDLAPLTAYVSELLHAANAGIPPAASKRRLVSAFVIFCDALQALDRDPPAAGKRAALIDDAIAVAAAAFTAPPAPTLRD